MKLDQLNEECRSLRGWHLLENDAPAVGLKHLFGIDIHIKGTFFASKNFCRGNESEASNYASTN